MHSDRHRRYTKIGMPVPRRRANLPQKVSYSMARHGRVDAICPAPLLTTAVAFGRDNLQDLRDEAYAAFFCSIGLDSTMSRGFHLFPSSSLPDCREFTSTQSLGYLFGVSAAGLP